MPDRVEVAEPAVTVTMFGTVRVDVDGRAAEVKSRRERAVLARLVAADGHVVSTDRLVEDLWDGEPPPKALGGLQVHVSNLRRILEPRRAPRTPARILVSEAPGYALRLPREVVDVWRFADLLAATPTDPEQRLGRLDAALALWAGTPFGPHAAQDWAGTAVTQLEELRMAALEQRAADALALGRPAEVVTALAAECERHPAREELFRLTALAQYRLGRQADALATLRTLREYLSDELGVDPAPPVRELESAILQQDPSLAATTPVSAPPQVAESGRVTTAAGAPGPAIAGREDELANLGGHAEAIRRAGRLGIVWVTAEAGGGKSTLAQRVVARLADDGWTTAVGHCPEVEGAPTAWAWREVIGELGGANELDDPFLIARQVRGLCRSGAGGIVIVLDDVHRADSATLQVLRQSATWLTDRPLLIVATYRPSEAGTELMATGAALVTATVDHLALSGLSDDGIRAVAAEAGLSPLTDDALSLLRSRTDGNPLFVRELAKLVASRGARDARTVVPTGVREVLLQRVERLPADTVSALRLLAVCGRGADVDTVVALWSDEAADSEDAVLDAVDTAAVAGLLSTEGERVRFTHVLMRDAVYDAIPTLRRRRLHWRTMEYLRSRSDARPDELAAHAALGASASTAEEALTIVEKAARRKADGDLAADSAPLWQHAVDLHLLAGHDGPSAGDDARKALVEAQCELVTALAHRGETVRARALREQAYRLACDIDDAELVVAALTCWRTPWIWSTRTKGVLDAAIVSALESALATATGAERALLLITAAMEYEGSDDQLAIDLSQEAVEIASGTDDLELRCATLNTRLFTALGPDSHADYPRLAHEFLLAAQEAGSLEYTAAARFYLFMLRTSENDLPAAVAEMELALQTATSGRVGELVVVLSAFSAVIDVLRGDLDAAQLKYTALSDQLRAAGVPAGDDFHLIGQLCVGWYRGSISELVDELERRYIRAPQTVVWIYVVALLDVGRVDEARVIATSGVSTSRDYYWTSGEAFHVRALVRLGMVDEAAALYTELLDWSGTVAGLNAGSVAFGPVDLLLADLADLIGDHVAAQEHRQIATQVEATLREGLIRIGSAAQD